MFNSCPRSLNVLKIYDIWRREVSCSSPNVKVYFIVTKVFNRKKKKHIFLEIAGCEMNEPSKNIYEA